MKKQLFFLLAIALLFSSCRKEDPKPSFEGEYLLSDVRVSIKKEPQGLRVKVADIDYGIGQTYESALAASIMSKNSMLTIVRESGGLYMRWVNLEGGFTEGFLVRL